MAEHQNKLSRFWQELKRRRVIHVITVYASAAFVIIELIGNLTEPLNLPTSLSTIVIIVLAVGFPLAVILSWIYDLTGEGIERTMPMDEITDDRKAKVPNAWKIATYASFVIIAGLLALNIISRGDMLKPGMIQSMVVLPFHNYTGDEDLEYFVAGMHSSLIGDMGKVSGLRIISETTANAFKNVDKSIPEIASEIGVDAIVEPTVTCLGDTICLQVKVFSAFPEEKLLWVTEYREDKGNMLDLYNRITRQIADEVKVELTETEERRLSGSKKVDKDAYDYYMKGLQYWDQLNQVSLQKALDLMNRAIELDPDFAPAYAGVAEVWLGMAQMGLTPPDIAGPKIFEYLDKAIQLDPEYPRAHYNRARVAVWTEWKWDKGEREFLKALAVNPNDAYSRAHYAHLLIMLQRTEEALVHSRLAVDLDPLNPFILTFHGIVLEEAGEYQEATEVIGKAYEMTPDSYFIQHRFRHVLEKNGEYEKAFELEKRYLNFGEDVIKSLDRIFKEQGRLAAYEQIVNLYEMQVQDSYVNPLWIGEKYIQIGQYEKGMDYIEKAYEIHDPNMPYLGTRIVFGDYDELHDNPRYLNILKKMNLPLPESD